MLYNILKRLTGTTMEDMMCQYNHKGRACPLGGSIKLLSDGRWMCHIHFQSIPEGQEEEILDWIKKNKGQIAKARQYPLQYDLPSPPLNYSRKPIKTTKSNHNSLPF